MVCHGQNIDNVKTACYAPGVKYHISAVARMSGLSIDAIRAWERRYGIVKPERDGAGIRPIPTRTSPASRLLELQQSSVIQSDA